MTYPLIAAVIAVAACLMLGRVADTLARRMSPRQAVQLVTASALALSLASGIALTAIAIAMIAGLSFVAAEGDWSASILHSEIPIPAWLGAVATLAVSVLLTRAALRTVTIALALIRADRLCRSIRVHGNPVVFVDDDSADAYTVAGIRGCVIISRRLFARLQTEERRVLTAHELSHLTRRHHLYVHIADIAAAGNPLLNRVAGAVRFGVERWADEDAATSVGNRRATGRALARVALLRSAMAGPTRPLGLQTAFGRPILALGIAATAVASRVQALLQSAPPRRTGRTAVAVALALVVLALGVLSLADIHDAIEDATPYLTVHPGI